MSFPLPIQGRRIECPQSFQNYPTIFSLKLSAIRSESAFDPFEVPIGNRVVSWYVEFEVVLSLLLAHLITH